MVFCCVLYSFTDNVAYIEFCLHKLFENFIYMFYRKVGGRMKDYIEKRAVELAQYIIENNATVRKTAKIFNISKSTVHKDVHERLSKINPALYKEAQAVLEQNKAERHIRGGMATKEKYLQGKKHM